MKYTLLLLFLIGVKLLYAQKTVVTHWNKIASGKFKDTALYPGGIKLGYAPRGFIKTIELYVTERSVDSGEILLLLSPRERIFFVVDKIVFESSQGRYAIDDGLVRDSVFTTSIEAKPATFSVFQVSVSGTTFLKKNLVKEMDLSIRNEVVRIKLQRRSAKAMRRMLADQL